MGKKERKIQGVFNLVVLKKNGLSISVWEPAVSVAEVTDTFYRYVERPIL